MAGSKTEALSMSSTRIVLRCCWSACDGEANIIIFAQFVSQTRSVTRGGAAPIALIVSSMIDGEPESSQSDDRMMQELIKFGNVGGQMAFYLGFTARDLIRGVATTGAVLSTQPKEPVPGQPLSFFIVGGEQDPLVKDIAEAKPRLTEKKHAVIYRQLKDFGKEYLLDTTLEELKVWLDSLDRI